MQLGQIVGGKYRVVGKLDAGAMGEIFRAIDELGRPVAIKAIRPEIAKEPVALARFRREAKIVKKLRSPFIPSVLGAGVTRLGEPWIAFEHLEGETLRERLSRVRRLPLREVAWIVDDVLAGLEHAHAQGVIHRDIKPSNIFLARDGRGGERAKVLDFGVSKGGPDEEGGITVTDEILGSPSFIAPEQVEKAGDVDGRADVYGVAVVAFLALSEKYPVEGENAALRAHYKCVNDPYCLAQVTGVPWSQGIEGFFRRGLARDVAERFPTAREARACWRQAVGLQADEGGLEREGASP